LSMVWPSSADSNMTGMLAVPEPLGKVAGNG
jgi:hypothetical protein